MALVQFQIRVEGALSSCLYKGKRLQDAETVRLFMVPEQSVDYVDVLVVAQSAETWDDAGDQKYGTRYTFEADDGLLPTPPEGQEEFLCPDQLYGVGCPVAGMGGGEGEFVSYGVVQGLDATQRAVARTNIGIVGAAADGQLLAWDNASNTYVPSTPALPGVGTVTSVAVSGSDGIEVDSGSPITAAGTIQLGVNAVAMRTTINVEAGATADQTGAEILAALLPVDGPGSGLDADTLDGFQASDFSAASLLTHAGLEIVSTTGETVLVSASDSATVTEYILVAQAGAGAYIRDFLLPPIGTVVGRLLLVRLDIAASTNPILTFVNPAPSGITEVTKFGSGTAQTIHLAFMTHDGRWERLWDSDNLATAASIPENLARYNSANVSIVTTEAEFAAAIAASYAADPLNPAPVVVRGIIPLAGAHQCDSVGVWAPVIFEEGGIFDFAPGGVFRCESMLKAAFGTQCFRNFRTLIRRDMPLIEGDTIESAAGSGTGTFTYKEFGLACAHGFSNLDAVRLVNNGGTFPGGLIDGTSLTLLSGWYWIRDATETTFRIAASAGGAAIIPATAGSGRLTIYRMPSVTGRFGGAGRTLEMWGGYPDSTKDSTKAIQACFQSPGWSQSLGVGLPDTIPNRQEVRGGKIMIGEGGYRTKEAILFWDGQQTIEGVNLNTSIIQMDLVPGNMMSGTFIDTDIDPINHTISCPNHNLETGQPVVFGSDGTLPSFIHSLVCAGGVNTLKDILFVPNIGAVFKTNDIVQFAGSSLPAPIVAATDYRLCIRTSESCKVRLVSTGALVNLTTDAGSAYTLTSNKPLETNRPYFAIRFGTDHIRLAATEAAARLGDFMLVNPAALGTGTHTIKNTFDAWVEVRGACTRFQMHNMAFSNYTSDARGEVALRFTGGFLEACEIGFIGLAVPKKAIEAHTACNSMWIHNLDLDQYGKDGPDAYEYRGSPLCHFRKGTAPLTFHIWSLTTSAHRRVGFLVNGNCMNSTIKQIHFEKAIHAVEVNSDFGGERIAVRDVNISQFPDPTSVTAIADDGAGNALFTFSGPWIFDGDMVWAYGGTGDFAAILNADVPNSVGANVNTGLASVEFFFAARYLNSTTQFYLCRSREAVNDRGPYVQMGAFGTGTGTLQLVTVGVMSNNVGRVQIDNLFIDGNKSALPFYDVRSEGMWKRMVFPRNVSVGGTFSGSIGSQKRNSGKATTSYPTSTWDIETDGFLTLQNTRIAPVNCIQP